MSDNHYPALNDIDAIQQAFESAGYICTTRIATVVRLAAALEKPVLIEGPPGVGKTELAKTCAMVVDRPLVRLQCYEGLDESKALYEWKYGKQLLYTQLLKEQLGDVMDGARGLTESMNRLHQFGDQCGDLRRALAELVIICQIESCLQICLTQIRSNPACALGYVSGARTHASGGPGLSWVAWPTRRRRATAAAPRSFVRGSAVGLDFSLQCTAARAGFMQECICAAFANRLCESLRCLDLRER